MFTVTSFLTEVFTGCRILRWVYVSPSIMLVVKFLCLFVCFWPTKDVTLVSSDLHGISDKQLAVIPVSSFLSMLRYFSPCGLKCLILIEKDSGKEGMSVWCLSPKVADYHLHTSTTEKGSLRSPSLPPNFYRDAWWKPAQKHTHE